MKRYFVSGFFIFTILAIKKGIVQSFFKKPYIVTGHGGDVTSLNKGIMKKLKVSCLKRAGKVTVVSEYLKNVVEELVERTIEEPMVCSMGVDTSKFGRQYRKENFFGQGNRKVVLFVGRQAEKEGIWIINVYQRQTPHIWYL